MNIKAMTDEQLNTLLSDLEEGRLNPANAATLYDNALTELYSEARKAARPVLVLGAPVAAPDFIPMVIA